MDQAAYLHDLFGLKGRVALVTGGSSGIGRAIALALGGAGARVIVAARTAATINATLEEVREAGGSADGIIADLSTRDGSHALADAVRDVDILVNSAGVNLRPPMADLDEATWDSTMRLNLEALARSQSEAWAPDGVTANVLVPGFVQTPLNRRLSSDPATVQALAARTLAGRNGVAGDFAGAAVFLASAASAYVVGQSIAVDGGFSVH